MASAAEGTLGADQEQELALHLVGCVECKAQYEGLRHAQSALSRLGAAEPSTRSLDAAIHRATTVLRGEADPGPAARAPAVPPPAHFVPPSADEAGRQLWDTALQETGELLEPLSDQAETDVADAADLSFHPETPPLLPDDRHDAYSPESPAPVPEPVQAPAIEPTGGAPAEPFAMPDAQRAPGPSIVDEPLVAPLETPAPQQPDETFEPMPSAPAIEPPLFDIGHTGHTGQSTADVPSPEEIDAPPLFEIQPPVRVSIGSQPPLDVEAPFITHDSGFAESPPAERVPRGARPVDRRRRPKAGPWIVAIAATLVLALLAGYLITRGTGIGGQNLPSASDVRARVRQVFAQMKSLKASFTIRRLDLYPVRQVNNSIAYQFSDGETSGRIVFDRSEGYREESTVSVGGHEISRAQLTRMSAPAEARTLSGAGAAARLVVEKNPPLGPPDGPLHDSLGVLEKTITPIADEIANAHTLTVVGLRRTPDREVVEVRFSVEPTELNRADQVDVLLDTRTYFPVHIRREIARSNARVLGPQAILSDNAIGTAFGDRMRITTEIDDLSDVVVDDIILPGDFILDVPQGVQTQTVDRGYASVTRSDLSTKLKFTPLLPGTLPTGFVEQGFAVYTGTPTGWGPSNTYPAPDGILNASYFDGKTTIVVTERHMKAPFTVTAPPVATGGLPVETRTIQRAEKTFTYVWSPEVPPVVYGFLGNVFAMASGFASADQLVAVVASLTETPIGAPADLQPSPAASQTGASVPTATP